MRSAHGWRQPELHFGEARTRFPASHEPPGGTSQEPCAHLRSKCAPRMGGGSRSFILARLELASRHPTNRLAALRGNPALTSDQNELRAWGHKNFGAFAPCKRFAQQNLGGGRIHFARAFQFPERNPKKEVTTYVVTSFFGAGDEARTRYLHLGKVALYQMSYARGTLTIIADSFAFVKPYFSFFRRFWSCRLANAEKL